MAKKGVTINNLGSFITDKFLSNLGFIAFMGLLATIYIANAHFAEHNVREVQMLQQEIKDLRWEYMSLQSDNMYNSMQSIVEDNVKEEGLRMYRSKPNKITVEAE